MKMNELPEHALLSAKELAPATAPVADVFHQLGAITRQLHDTMQQLGVMPQLAASAESLPDARSRLTYIAEKTGAAAEKVLNSVDHAKSDQAGIAARTREMAAALVNDPVKAVASGAVMNFVDAVDAAIARTDGHLTDIMLAQDFHDLTGQVVAKVVKLAAELEDSLVKLLVQAAPGEHGAKAEPSQLQGPVVNPEGRSDVVSDQSEVDDLLASMGF